MGATVSSVLASVTVSEIRVASTAQIGAATVSRVIPQAAIQAVIAAASPYLDVAGWYKLYQETISPTDILFFNMSKAASDSISVSDNVDLAVEKTLGDSFGMTDVIVVTIIILRSFADAVSISDSQIIDVEKPLSDSVSTTESLAKDADKSLSDSASIGDYDAKLITKPLSDSLTIQDQYSSVINYARAFVDTTTTSEVIDKVFIKSISDSASFPDNLVIQIIPVSPQLLNTYVLNYFTLNGP